MVDANCAGAMHRSIDDVLEWLQSAPRQNAWYYRCKPPVLPKRIEEIGWASNACLRCYEGWIAPGRRSIRRHADRDIEIKTDPHTGIESPLAISRWV